MGRRKLRIYGDADLEPDLEEYLRNHPWINYRGARELGFAGRDDAHHYHEALQQERVLVSHDDDFLNNAAHPLHETHGVIVIKRGQDLEAQVLAFERFLHEVWPELRDERGWKTLGFLKIHLSTQGFHWESRTPDGNQADGYRPF